MFGVLTTTKKKKRRGGRRNLSSPILLYLPMSELGEKKISIHLCCKNPSTQASARKRHLDTPGRFPFISILVTVSHPHRRQWLPVPPEGRVLHCLNAISSYNVVPPERKQIRIRGCL